MKPGDVTDVEISVSASRINRTVVESGAHCADIEPAFKCGAILGDDNFRRASTYVDKILKGAKPADLPIEQPAKFELIVNLKTAKAKPIHMKEFVQAVGDTIARFQGKPA